MRTFVVEVINETPEKSLVKISTDSYAEMVSLNTGDLSQELEERKKEINTILDAIEENNG